jgi:hypothetical protein
MASIHIFLFDHLAASPAGRQHAKVFLSNPGEEKKKENAMSTNTHLNGLLARTRQLFDNGPTLVDRDSNSRNVLVVVDLCEAAWRTVTVFLAEDGRPADLRQELGTLSPETLPQGMVAAWVKIFQEKTNIVDPEDLTILAETVVYLVTTLREDPALEIEDVDRMITRHELELAA